MNLGGTAEKPKPSSPVRLTRQLSVGTRPINFSMAVVFWWDAPVMQF